MCCEAKELERAGCSQTGSDHTFDNNTFATWLQVIHHATYSLPTDKLQPSVCVCVCVLWGDGAALPCKGTAHTRAVRHTP